MSSIEASKQQDVSRLIYALGIRQVGAKTGKVLASRFGSLDVLMNASVAELTEVPDIGGVTAQSIFDWFHQPQSVHMIERLREAGVNFESKRTVTDSRFAGKQLQRQENSQNKREKNCWREPQKKEKYGSILWILNFFHNSHLRIFLLDL